MRCAVRAACGVTVIAGLANALGAQSAVVIDVGASAARFTSENVSVAGPQVRFLVTGVQPRLSESIDVGAMGANGTALGYAGITAAYRTETSARMRQDITGEFSALGSTTTPGRAITALVGARSLYEAGTVGGWVRGSAQVASRGTGVYGGGSVDGASWLRLGRSQLSTSLVQEWTRASLYEGPGRSRPNGSVPVQYLEGAISLSAERDAAVFNAGMAIRRDAGANALYEQSFNGTASFWTGESTSIVLAAAHQLPDYVHGADAMDAVSVSVRFGQTSPAAARASLSVAMIQFTGTADTRSVRIHVPDARTVEIMGDFTNWEPRSMTRNGAVFESTMRVTSGTHRLMLRIDGGEWHPPANTPTVDDDFGGRVGLLVVP